MISPPTGSCTGPRTPQQGANIGKLERTLCLQTARCCFSAQVFLYGTGDAEGMSYLASGTLPDWLHYTFSAYAYTVELPPLTWDLGGFHLASHLISKACVASYQVPDGPIHRFSLVPPKECRKPSIALLSSRLQKSVGNQPSINRGP